MIGGSGGDSDGGGIGCVGDDGGGVGGDGDGGTDGDEVMAAAAVVMVMYS